MLRPVFLATSSRTSKLISLLLLYVLIVFSVAWPALATITKSGKGIEKRALGCSTKQNCPSCQATNEDADLADRIDQLATIGRSTQLNPLKPVQRSIFEGTLINFVSTTTGQLGFAVDDLIVSGTMPLVFRRVYASDGSEDKGLGKGWSFIFDDRIRIDGGLATLITGEGRQIDFQADGSGTNFKLKTAEPSLHQSFALGKEVVIEREASLTRVYKKFRNDYRLSRIVDANDNSIDIDFDGGGKIGRIRSSGGTISLEWSTEQSPRLLAVNDSAGRRVTYQQDGNGLRVSKDAEGAQWTYDYKAGRLVQVLDPLERVLLRVEYSRTGRVVSSGDGVGADQFAYSPTEAIISRRTLVTDPLGVTTAFEHDLHGAITATLQGDGELMLRAEYNSAHRLTRLWSQAGNDEQFGFDAQNRLVQATSSAGSYRTNSYDDAGRISSIIENGIRTDYTRDTKGNVVSARSGDPAGSYRIERDGSGSVTKIESDTGRKVVSEYDGAGRLIAFRPNESGRFQTEIDGVGQVTAEHFPSGLIERYERDARGLLTRKVDNQGRAISIERDQAGLVRRFTRADGSWASAQRDQAGRIVTLNSSSGRSRHFAYDPRGGLTDYTDSLGRHTNFKYDTRGRIESFQDDAGRRTLIQRDQKSGHAYRISRLDRYGRRQDFDRTGRPVTSEGLLAEVSSRAEFLGPRHNAHPLSAPQAEFGCLFGPDPSFDASVSGFDNCWDPFGGFGGGGGEGWGDYLGLTHEQCVSRQMAICLSRQAACLSRAFGAAAVAAAACIILAAADPTAGAICAVAAAIKYQADVFSCSMSYANCLLEVGNRCAGVP